MNDLFSSWQTAAASTNGQSEMLNLSILGNSSVSQQGADASLSYEKVVELIDHSLSSLKVYVVESEITSAQNSVKAIVSQSSF